MKQTFFGRLGLPVSTVALAVALALPAAAHETTAGPAALTPELTSVRDGLTRFKDVNVATAEGYVSLEECVASPEGGMGVHYLNKDLIGSTDPAKPTVLQYVPNGSGMDLAGAEWLVMKGAAGGHHPHMFGRKFAGPMPGHEPSMPKEAVHYDLHAWLFMDAPSGVYADFNPNVKCPE
jgi:hypothetical protein